MQVVIINSGGANIASVRYAITRLGVNPILTTDKTIIQQADRVILPGVGYGATIMQQLIKYNLVEVIQTLKQPVLGICVGMQILYEHLAEGDVKGLGIITGTVQCFDDKPPLTLPHTGWNKVKVNMSTLDSIAGYYYFVHSYFAPINEHTIAYCDYGISFSAISKYNNFIGIQCHPEKSANNGNHFLQRFLADDIA